MLAKLKESRLFKNTFIYTALQFVNKGIPFLLLPLLTRYLTPEDYGIVATFNTFVSVLSVFIGLSIPGAIGVSYFHFEQKELQKYTGNAFIILIANLLAVVLLISWGGGYLFETFGLPVFWIYMAAVAVFMQTISNTNLTLWRSKQQAKPFAYYEGAQTLVNVLLSLLLVVFLSQGWEGRAWAISLSYILFGILSMFFIYKRGYIVFDYTKKHLKDVLKFGIHLIPHQMALWMRSGVDILLITKLVGISATGLYNVGFQFGAVVGILAGAFNNAYSPYLYEKLKNMTPEIQKNLVKFTYFYFVGILVFSIVLSIFFVWLVPYFLGNSFEGASEYIVLISIAHAFQGMYLMVVNYIFYAKKNHLLSMVTISTSIFHVLLSYVLIDNYGAIGAAYASVVSFFVTFLLVWRISSKAVWMPWLFWRAQ